MRIAQIAPLAEPVPPDRYGGTERVVAYLADELVRRGHEVTLFASGDSGTEADLVAATERALRRDPTVSEPLAPHISELGMAFKRAGDFDIMHSHVDYLAFPVARLVATPTLHTLHGRLDLPHLVHVFGEFHDVPLVSISEAQRQPLRHLSLNWAGTVYHGLRLEDYPYSPTPGGYLAFCGRICPEKRPDLAIEVARRAGLPLKMAATETTLSARSARGSTSPASSSSVRWMKPERSSSWPRPSRYCFQSIGRSRSGWS